MPFHLSSTPAAHRRPPLRSRSLSCKSRPTCTLSLAHVSACKPENVMQVDSTLQLGLFVAVPLPQPAKSKTRSTRPTIPNDINVIPFPTSAQTTPSTSSSHTSNHHQKKEDSPASLSHSPPRKRARKGSLSTSPPSSSRSSTTTPSSRVKALAQRRPPTPSPDCWPDSADDDMGVVDKSPVVQSSSADLVQQQTNQQPSSQAEKKRQDVEEKQELPPYSLSPPPYSPQVVAPIPIITSPTPIPIHVPIPVVPPPSSSSSSPSSSIPESSSRPLPVSSPPPPPSSPISPPPQRRSRISPSELRFFIFLYRSVVSGLELRRQARLKNTQQQQQQVGRARDGSRREQHLDGVLVEVDDDDEDDVDVKADTNTTPSSLNEALEAQDALLALRLRGFLKWNGVDEWMLKVNSSSSSPPSSRPSSPPSPTGVNPFLEDDRMDVDVQQQLPMLSSRHLITVLRMRGTCGGSNRQGGPVGLKFKRDESKLRMCAFKAEGDD